MTKAEYPANVTDDTPIQQTLTWRIHQVHSKLNTHAAKFLEKVSGIGLAQWRVMQAIGLKGSTTHSDIRRYIAVDKGQLSRSLKGMIEEGLVEARSDRNDHRQQQLSLTTKGRRIFNITMPMMRKRQTYLMSTLTDAERKTIFVALEKLELAAGNHEFLK